MGVCLPLARPMWPFQGVGRRAEGIGGVGPDWLNHYAKPRIDGKWKECEASKLGKGQTRVAEVTLGSREWMIMWELLRL